MTTKHRDDDTDAWSLSDWSRAFDARETKTREHTSISYSADRLRDQALGPGLEPGDSWSAKDYVQWSRANPDQADRWLDATDIVATLDKQSAEAGVKSSQADRQRDERQAQRDLEHDVEYRTALMRLELKAAEARRTLGDAEIARRTVERQARWDVERAESKLYYAEVKKARANHTDPPPHYHHSKVAWKKWQESQRLLQFRQFNRGMLH